MNALNNSPQNPFFVSQELSFSAAMEQISKSIEELKEQEKVERRKEAEASAKLSKLKEELSSLEPELKELGIKIESDGNWKDSTSSVIKEALEKASNTQLNLSKARAKQAAREEQSKKNFWGKIKSAVGGAFDSDQTQDYEAQLNSDYIELAKTVLNTGNDKSKLLPLASESLIERVPEITSSSLLEQNNYYKASNKEKKISAEIESLISTATRNIDTCSNLNEIKQSLEGFSENVRLKLLEYAEYSLSGLEMDTLTACAYLKAEKVNDASNIIHYNIISKPGNGNVKVTALAKIACQFIETQSVLEAKESEAKESEPNTDPTSFSSLYREASENLLEHSMLFSIDQIKEPADADIKVQGWSLIAQQMVKYGKVNKIPATLDYLFSSKAHPNIEVKALKEIALKQIEQKQTDGSKRTVEILTSRSADKSEKVAALTEIAKRYLLAGEIDAAQNLNQFVIPRIE
ncbi:MAG: hypothetical protein KME13_17275 [Myxacorys californica WJT36-NPBG1]|jgi:hypothetical protein|nr:hypothetical protein [Myxacorys californica WJT36-NPBG1]